MIDKESTRIDHGSAIRALHAEETIETVILITSDYKTITCDSTWTATDYLKSTGYYDQEFIARPAEILTLTEFDAKYGARAFAA